MKPAMFIARPAIPAETGDARGGETPMMIRHLHDPIRTEVAFLGDLSGAC